MHQTKKRVNKPIGKKTKRVNINNISDQKNKKKEITHELKHKLETTNVRRDFFKSLLVK
jgi:hypothetical protein